MIRKASQKPPTMVPLGSEAGQRELRQCECCDKLQSVAEGFSVEHCLCRECNEGFDEPMTETVGGCTAYTFRPSWWARFKNWLRGTE